MSLWSSIKKGVGAIFDVAMAPTNAIMGLAGDVIGGIMDANAQEEANEMNYKIHRENLEWNKPINQMRRFEEAGLNPNLIYTQGNAGNATAQPVMKAESLNLRPSQSLATMYGLQNMKEQNENLRAQNTLISSQSAAAAENARRTKLENDFFEEHNYWPGQESAFVRGLRGGIGYLPQLYFNSVDAMYDLFFGGPAPRGMNKVDWSGGRRG